jgi:dihydroanticapsin dehydrogenase
MRLKDKVAIITGAASGIGRATALLFAEEGAHVIVADIDREGAGETAAMVQAKKGQVLVVHADISKEEQTKRIASETLNAFGRIDILVNNAAAFVLKGFDATVEDWRRSLDVNVIGTALSTKHAVEEMKKTGGGAIVNVSSISAFVAQPNFFVYSASKAAILQMTRNMAMDLAPFRIRVNAVCPGVTLTPEVYRNRQASGLTEDQWLARVNANTLLKRIADPREVAHAIVFMASDAASYVTGAHLMVDGGWTAQ